ncbi:ribA/ribD-fused uncharacterized protein [Actinoalloteichus hoggarensis]|nr:ribA/ribD-fused uncharacterized protein [Actinoalloteichus hoggarensis]
MTEPRLRRVDQRIAELRRREAAGERLRFVLFWSGLRRADGDVRSECLSQWWFGDFTVDGRRYPTAEHYMMERKARLFGDDGVAERILVARHPGEAKRLGRLVRGFDRERWDAHRERIVIAGNLAKFTAHEPAAAFLRSTGSRILVEASPVDAVWGIGLAARDDAATLPSRWPGRNLLGFALMEVRARLGAARRGRSPAPGRASRPPPRPGVRRRVPRLPPMSSGDPHHGPAVGADGGPSPVFTVCPPAAVPGRRDDRAELVDAPAPVGHRGEAGIDLEALRHHGDVEATPELVDFAVNVRLDAPPRWLRDRLAAALSDLGRYPSAAEDAATRSVVAARHGRRPEEVLVLAGAAECFALLPELRPRHAAVVHPSFTEPELALRQAGVPVSRVLLPASDGHRLRPELVPADADLVVLGNPTNPTSVLHPAAVVRSLARPGRTLVVDEAFIDAVPGEAESLAGDGGTPGLVVVRSLTKTWALAGLRAGYVLAAPELLGRLAARRPHWPVGSLVHVAVRACCSPGALAEAEAAAVDLRERRRDMIAELAALPGLRVEQPAHGPFLLLTVPDGAAVRTGLRQRGIAVRRCDTFPGLTEDHLRVAVRSAERTSLLGAALSDLLRDTRVS